LSKTRDARFSVALFYETLLLLLSSSSSSSLWPLLFLWRAYCWYRFCMY